MRDRSCLKFRSALAGCALFVFGSFLAGCSTTPEVTSYVNPVSGRRTDTVSQNLLDAPGNNREMLWLNAYRDFSDRYRYKYYLEAIYGARQDVGLLEIGPFRSLIVTADGHEMIFNTFGDIKEDEDKGALFETARYEASADDVHRIADAKKVTVQLKGRRGLITRQFAPENFEKFRKFVQQSDDANL
jgi:hypothetical protein